VRWGRSATPGHRRLAACVRRALVHETASCWCFNPSTLEPMVQLAGSRRPALRRASRCQTIHTSGLACAKSGGGKVRTDLAITLPLSPIPRSSPQLPACLFPKWILRSISSLAVCNKALRSAILYNHARLVVACNEIKLEEFHSHEGCKGCWSPIHLLA
jgi:hypothetical protein